MAMLKHELVPLGTAWSTTADGQLALGTTILNDRNDLVDAVKDVSGAAATVFSMTLASRPTSRTPMGHAALEPSSQLALLTTQYCAMDIAIKVPRRSWVSLILPSTSLFGMLGRKRSAFCLLACRSPTRKCS